VPTIQSSAYPNQLSSEIIKLIYFEDSSILSISAIYATCYNCIFIFGLTVNSSSVEQLFHINILQAIFNKIRMTEYYNWVWQSGIDWL